MYEQVDKPKENKSRAATNCVSQHQSNSKSPIQFVDNRPEAVSQRKLMKIANNSPQVKQTAQLHTVTDNLKINVSRIDPTTKRTVLQKAAKVALDGLGLISGVTVTRRPSWRKEVYDYHGLPYKNSMGQHICHKKPWMLMYEEWSVNLKGETIADTATQLGCLATKTAVEKAIWESLLNEFNVPENTELGAGGPNSSMGSSAKHRRNLIRQSMNGTLVYPIVLGKESGGAEVINDQDDLIENAAGFGVDASTPAERQAIIDEAVGLGCTIL